MAVSLDNMATSVFAIHHNAIPCSINQTLKTQANVRGDCKFNQGVVQACNPGD